MREPKDADNVAEIRLAITGAASCGKSALAVRFLTRRFIGEYDSHKDATLTRTVGVADKVINLQLKDTTGIDWLKSSTSAINWASAVVVVYSITDRGSFLVANHILESVHKLKPLNSGCTLLLGNKSDLKHLREVDKREARRLAMDYGVRFIECSAAESYEEIHGSFTRLILEALLVQNAKKLSFELIDEEKKSKEPRRRRSSSQPQPHYIPSCQQKENMLENKDSIEHVQPSNSSPGERRREPREPRQRKQSLRRKISGYLVGSQNGNR